MAQQFSVFLSDFLNEIGYSPEMVKLRQQGYDAVSYDDDFTSMMLCGSKREGLTLPFENDYDTMIIKKRIECYEQCENSDELNQPTTFLMEQLDTTAHGYARLRCVSLNPASVSLVEDSLVEIHGVRYLSSDNWKQKDKENEKLLISNTDWVKYFTPCRDNKGPSSPFVVPGGISCDWVNAIRCHCPRLISLWQNRTRLYEWPSKELVDTVSTLDSHVVPIGYKGSPDQFLEWRICFTKGEICLIESLNDCLTKIIILLKLIAKHALKPICKDITSYTMKNLVMWMAEKYPTHLFTESRLMIMIRKSLKVLSKCIINKKLPSYMIQERNLLADRLSDDHARQLCATIDTLLHEGPRMLFRFPKIRDGLNTLCTAPDQFFLYARQRRLIEQAVISGMPSIVEQYIRFIFRSPLPPITEILRSVLCGPSFSNMSIDTLIEIIEKILCGDECMKNEIERVKNLYS